MMIMKKILLMIVLLVVALTACDREDSHVTVADNPEHSQGGAVVGFSTAGVTGTKFGDTHLYGFDNAEKMILHKYYATQQELAGDLFQLETGKYTFVAVLNVGKEYAPTVQARADAPLLELSLQQLLSYVKQSEANYPDMLTGMLTQTIANNEVMRMEIALHDKAGAIPLTACRVTATLTLPDAAFGEYQEARVRATSPHNLRAVAEFFRKGATEPAVRTTAVLTPAEQAGSYTLTTEVPQGEYDMVVWVDYTNESSTDDLWYNAQSLQTITLIAPDKHYTAGSATREVFYGATTLTATGAEATVSLTTERPQAKYLLVADDLVRYRELMVANPEKYVPLNQLSITVQYEGYLPDGFNALTGKPNHSELGYTYQCELPAIAADDTEVRVAEDYVFVNGTESSVVVTVVVTDKQGNTISRVKGITVKYKRNLVTTLRGNFLTAGVVNPGINIDTDWDGVYDVEF